MTAPAMSFDAALAAIDVEAVDRRDNGTHVHQIVGLDDVRAAHAEAVRVAVEAEREACAKVCLDLRCRWCRELGEDTNGNHADCCACRDDAAAIRARGVAKPRTDGEAATRSGEGAKS